MLKLGQKLVGFRRSPAPELGIVEMKPQLQLSLRRIPQTLKSK